MSHLSSYRPSDSTLTQQNNYLKSGSLTRPCLNPTHSLRTSVLSISGIAYDTKRQQILTADISCLRLYSLRKELLAKPFQPYSPNVLKLVYNESQDVYFCLHGPAKKNNDHSDSCVIKIVHPSLKILGR